MLLIILILQFIHTYFSCYFVVFFNVVILSQNVITRSSGETTGFSLVTYTHVFPNILFTTMDCKLTFRSASTNQQPMDGIKALPYFVCFSIICYYQIYITIQKKVNLRNSQIVQMQAPLYPSVSIAISIILCLKKSYSLIIKTANYYFFGQ